MPPKKAGRAAAQQPAQQSSSKTTSQATKPPPSPQTVARLQRPQQLVDNMRSDFAQQSQKYRDDAQRIATEVQQASKAAFGGYDDQQRAAAERELIDAEEKIRKLEADIDKVEAQVGDLGAGRLAIMNECGLKSLSANRAEAEKNAAEKILEAMKESPAVSAKVLASAEARYQDILGLFNECLVSAERDFEVEKEVKESILELRRTGGDLKQQLTTCQQFKSASDREIGSLEEKLLSARGELEAAQEAVLSETGKQLQGQLDKEKQRGEALEAGVKRLEKDLRDEKSLRSSAEAAKDREIHKWAEQSKLVEEKESRIGELEKGLKKAEEGRVTASKARETLSGKHEEIKGALEKVKSELRDGKESYATVARQKKELAEVLEKLEEKHKTALHEGKTSRESFESEQRNLRKAEELKSSLKKQLEEVKSSAADFESRLQSLQSKHDELSWGNETLKREKAKLESEYESSKKTALDSKQAMDEEIASLKQSEKRMQEASKAQESRVKTLIDEKSGIEAEADDLRSELTKKATEGAGNRQLFDSAHQAFEREQSRLQKELERITDALEDVKGESATFEKRAQNAEAACSAKDKEMKQCVSKLEKDIGKKGELVALIAKLTVDSATGTNTSPETIGFATIVEQASSLTVASQGSPFLKMIKGPEQTGEKSQAPALLAVSMLNQCYAPGGRITYQEVMSLAQAVSTAPRGVVGVTGHTLSILVEKRMADIVSRGKVEKGQAMVVLRCLELACRLLGTKAVKVPSWKGFYGLLFKPDFFLKNHYLVLGYADFLNLSIVGQVDIGAEHHLARKVSERTGADYYKQRGGRWMFEENPVRQIVPDGNGLLIVNLGQKTDEHSVWYFPPQSFQVNMELVGGLPKYQILPHGYDGKEIWVDDKESIRSLHDEFHIFCTVERLGKAAPPAEWEAWVDVVEA